MTAAALTSPAEFNPDLLDRMTGVKGSVADIDAKCHTLLLAIAPVFAAAFEKATGVEIDARPVEVRQGRRRELLSELKRDMAYCEASIAGWSEEIAGLCGTKLVIGLVECLLGGSDPNRLTVAARPLSAIELDMSLVVFEQLNDSLRGLVSADPKAKASVAKPQLELPDEADDPIPDFHAAALTLDVGFGAVVAPLTLILPQAILLKSRVSAPALGKKANPNAEDWTERLSDRVSQSQISLQAAVALAPLPLGEISRLQPGDLIAFADNGDIEVTLSANGKPLYTCALGRAGTRYMVKVERQAGPDENWKTDFA
ncbi:MAG: FliM/FliN family flagellar motor switch protein [Hoeflea sp.]|uniref:FliM/FliN family flagellar motor switch protein n=1 Tax=Hoeflea sp. TaxID=1940281 RepID=UPI001E0CACE3|nr:FliM/FliN family flagellar motor switch protein [Hoeflea sp.]MBU4531135.1 FliM/FliN family flagellar motor switch protein [Alphaproteobacteria bacterium]MBU4545803.1 FliM/FliN family flagellar motor switch protein [Alphaproteobacteria bacterium]MBU4550772.1 FliM/FliN family flagellar motor switch protein [Alphaproteobacteria bacterium]MBV1724412.1 FliM/FliN family flagellar motor switch protein [Hoeflea sp.]MBV1760432.1 FliM/FliN family flagellar motor switch protein [Hoeflea sp.]